jgi:hypothetical protein
LMNPIYFKRPRAATQRDALAGARGAGTTAFIRHDEGASAKSIALPGIPGAQGGKAPSGSGGGNALGFPPTG